MMARCRHPISDGTLIGYWAHDLPDGVETDQVEEHLFACGDCSARLHGLAALRPGLATLVRQGRVSGSVSRALLNRMQHDGIHVRMYSLAPGETVPCAVFPGDDLVVAVLRADFSDVEAVTLSVTGPGDTPFSQLDNVPVSGPDAELLWATPAAVVRRLPSMRLQLTLASAGGKRAELGRYVLDHRAIDSAPD
jgi:hypothetical protein